MTRTIDKKRASILVLFCTYFLVYSISPLTFTFPDKKSHEVQYSSHRGTTSLLWELLFCPSEERSQNDVNTSIIIKKKRATVPEIAAAKLFSVDKTSLPKDCFEPLAPSTYRLPVFPTRVHGLYKGLNSLYTGQSPPSA